MIGILYLFFPLLSSLLGFKSPNINVFFCSFCTVKTRVKKGLGNLHGFSFGWDAEPSNQQLFLFQALLKALRPVLHDESCSASNF